MRSTSNPSIAGRFRLPARLVFVAAVAACHKLRSLMMDVDPDENTAKRRKLRKGTHSCSECRRRKVKCIFSSSNDTICVTCRRRGTKCISQALVDGHDEVGCMAGDAGKDATPHILPSDGGFQARPNGSISGHSSVHTASALPDGKACQHLHLHNCVLTHNKAEQCAESSTTQDNCKSTHDAKRTTNACVQPCHRFRGFRIPKHHSRPAKISPLSERH